MERTLATCEANFTTIERVVAAEENSPKFDKINSEKIGLMASLKSFFHEEALRE
jgi:hypothetical protein